MGDDTRTYVVVMVIVGPSILLSVLRMQLVYFVVVLQWSWIQ